MRSSPRSRLSGVPAYGFVNGEHAEQTPDNAAALDAVVGTPCRSATTPGHTPIWTTVTTQGSTGARSSRNEPLLERLSHGRDWRWFRYPVPRRGHRSRQARRGPRVSGRAADYRIAAVTIDFSDYAYNDPYTRCVAKGDDTAIVALENEYLEAAHDDALASQEMAKALYGTDIPQVLLTHVGAFDARMFPGCSSSTARWASASSRWRRRRTTRTTRRTTIPAFRGPVGPRVEDVREGPETAAEAHAEAGSGRGLQLTASTADTDPARASRMRGRILVV